jgi:hypothetical protein
VKLVLSSLIVIFGALALSACVDPNEERGICSYLGTCEMGLGTHIDLNYCKELGSCDDGTDPTEYTASGKPSVKPEPSDSSSSGSGDGSE